MCGEINPEVVRVELSIAEDNIIENLRTLLTRSCDAFRELHDSLNDLASGKLELAKARMQKLLHMLGNFRSEYHTFALYLARVLPNLERNLLYLDTYRAIRDLNRSIEILVLHLAAIARHGSEIVSKIGSLTVPFANAMLSTTLKLIDAATILTSNPRKSLEFVEEARGSLQQCRDELRSRWIELYAGGYRDLLLAFIDVLDRLELLVDDMQLLARLRV